MPVATMFTLSAAAAVAVPTPPPGKNGRGGTSTKKLAQIMLCSTSHMFLRR